MAALHGKEDPLLDPARFGRFLRQANDAEIADVRVIADDQFEVSPHKTDISMQRRTPVAAADGATDAGGAAAATARPAALRFRSGARTGAKRSEVSMVGVINLDAPEPAATARVVETTTVQPVADDDKDIAEAATRKKPARKAPARKKAAAGAAKTAAKTAGGATKAAKAAKSVKKSAKSAKPAKSASEEVGCEGRIGVIEDCSYEDACRLSPDAVALARNLLGQTFASDIGGERVCGVIIETEAYLGVHDPASHAWRGRRHRSNVGIYAEPGSWYVYRSYGIHWCVNLTTGPVGEGAAVLIRAVAPTVGVATMRARRGMIADRDLTNGPGKLMPGVRNHW